MNFYIKTHIVQKGETLEDIVSQYHIPDVEMLRYFHNQNVPKNHNHIGSIISVGQEIFIPEKTDIDRLLEAKKKRSEEKEEQQQNHLKNKILYPDALAIKNHYQVKISHSQGSSSEKISFDAYFQYVENTKDNLAVLRYEKENFLINDEKADTKLHDLAIEAIQFLYPLEFTLAQNLAKPFAITNLKEIKARWKNNKEQLLKMYSDSYSLRYINSIDEAIDEGLSKYILNDLFLQFLFAPYLEFEKGQSYTERSFHTYRILYQDTMEMKIIGDEIHIKQEAFCIDPRNPQQILSKWELDKEEQQEKNEEVSESFISGKYILDKNHKILKEAKIELQTNFYEEEIIQIEINSVES
jgi:LysM repeat protein